MLCCGVPLSLVTTREWREAMWKGKDRVRVTGDGVRKVTDVRATSMAAARRIFPGRGLPDGQNGAASDYGLCVSMLLAEYARRKGL